MIVRDCAKDLERALASIRDHVDECVIVDTAPEKSRDGTRDVAVSFGAKLYDFPWIEDFAAARNFASSKCSYDAVMWLDSDDTVENAPALLETAKKLMLTNVDVMYVRYDYEFDAAGHCTTRLWRERIVDRNRFTWKAPIHECQIANYRFEAAYAKPEFGLIRHNRKREDQLASHERLHRNLVILEKTEAEGKMETRLVYYWANTLMGLGRFTEAVEKFCHYIDHSGVPEERYAAMVSRSEAMRLIGGPMLNEAVQAALQAVAFRPDLASAYLHVAEVHLQAQRWRDAELWAKECLRHKDGAQNELVYNPKAIEARPHVILTVALANQNRIDESVEHLNAAQQFYPDDGMLNDVRRQVVTIHRKVTLVNSAGNLKRQNEEEGHPERTREMVKWLPDVIQSEAFIQRLMEKPRDPDKLTIALFCPVVGETWNPRAIERGIGGSEEAVINMARELTALGWNVEVYCQVDGPGHYPGFGYWYPFEAFGGDEDQFDVVVWWRNADAPIACGMNAWASYLWLHDTPIAQHWIPNYDDMIDRVMLLSRFHRSLYPWVKEEHVWYTQNATDPALWCEPKNEPGKMIYASCPSRGLLYLLRWWNYLREKAPHATLDIYYGWNVWARQNAVGDPNFGAMYHEVERLKDQPGVTWHGRVGQPELRQAFARSQLWAYPMNFPEISCLTAMHAQQHGVMPIVIDKRNAVAETVQHGEKLDVEIGDIVGQKIFMDTVIKHLNDPSLFSAAQKAAMVAWAREKYQWSTVAANWDQVMRADVARSRSQERRLLVKRGKPPRRKLAGVHSMA